MSLRLETPGTIAIDERTIATDPTEVILGKEILYRASTIKPREDGDNTSGHVRS